jgi:CRISPR-associated protein (TIGR03984 family)
MANKDQSALKLKKIKTQTIALSQETDDPLACLEKRFKDNGFVVAYMDFKVLIGRYTNQRCVFAGNETLDTNSLQYLQRLRVFNDRQELLIWRTEDNEENGSDFKGRMRIDQDGEKSEETPIVDANQVLWGTRAKSLDNGFTLLTEDRGTELILPFNNLESVDDKENRIFLETRNYIGYNDIGQAAYVDTRFVGFFFDNKELE